MCAAANEQKPVLYMSPKIKNCIDSWIFLREIRCQNSIHNKRVRCCIKICRPFIPLTDKAWYRPEWGWDDSENSTQITLGKDGWVAFRITAIKKLRAELTGVEQSNQGSPWLLMTDPSHALETSKLLSASVLASYPIFSPNTYRSTVMNKPHVPAKPKISQHQLLIMQNKKNDKQIKLASMKYFVLKHKNGKPDTKHCCDYCCMNTNVGKSLLRRRNGGDDMVPVPFAHTFSAIQLRRFISARLTPRNKALNIKQNQYVLENIEIIKYYYSHNYVSILPACLNKDMLLVCSNFFRWAIGVSRNKIDQPSLHAADPSFEGYSINMGGPRQIVYYEHDCADKIVAWLRTLAANSFQDPASDKIILSFGTKKLVYDQYQADYDEENCAKYFSRQSNGEILLPSLNYFLKTSDHLNMWQV